MREDLGAHLNAQLRVQVRERLVHQEDLRLADDRAAHRDALPLAAGELPRLAVEVVEEADDARGLLDPPAAPPAFGTLRMRRAKPMFSATVMCG